MSSAYTKEEVLAGFIEHVHAMVNYWINEVQTDKRGCAEGVAFSILALLDGSNIGFPAVDLAVQPHPADKVYCLSRDEKWFEPGMVFNDDCELHQLFCSTKKSEDMEEGRCPHGMFFSGAGACPSCGG